MAPGTGPWNQAGEDGTHVEGQAGTGRVVGTLQATYSQMQEGSPCCSAPCLELRDVPGDVRPGLTFLIVAPLFFIILISFALVRASGLLLLFQRFLLGPGPLPLFNLFFLLLGEGCFLLRSLEIWDRTRHCTWRLHEVYWLVMEEVGAQGGWPPPGRREATRKRTRRRAAPNLPSCAPASSGFLGAASQVYRMSHNIPMNDSPKERKKNL